MEEEKLVTAIRDSLYSRSIELEIRKIAKAVMKISSFSKMCL